MAMSDENIPAGVFGAVPHAPSKQRLIRRLRRQPCFTQTGSEPNNSTHQGCNGLTGFD
jgi:hypothetical protein